MPLDIVPAGDPGDFVVTSSTRGAEDIKTALAEADATIKAPPKDPDAPRTPTLTPEPAPLAEPSKADAPPAEPVAEPAAEPAAPEDPAVAEAAAKLPKGDSKAGKTLSDRARVIQAEINQLTALKHQTRQEAEATRLELAELRQQQERIREAVQQATAPVQPPSPAEPKEEDFETFGEFSRALAKFYRDEALKASRAESERLIAETIERMRVQEQQFREQQAFEQVVTSHNKNIEAARAAHPDFDDVVAGSALPTNPMMDTHIPRSPVSGELLHYLATHPDECTAIAALPAGPTLVALGRLEERIGAVKSGPTPVRTPVSQAKPPIKPVGASGKTADEVPDQNVSLDEHVRFWNNKDRERRAGGGRR